MSETRAALKKAPTRVQVQRILISLAVLLLALGVGNLFYGSFKARQYVELIETANARLAQPKRSVFPLIDPTIDTDRDQQHLRRLKGSHQFYQFVQRAGTWMMFLGLAASALSITLLPQPAQLVDRADIEPPATD